MKETTQQTRRWSQRVEWRDLVDYSRLETAIELSLPIPWLLIFLWSATYGWSLLTVIAAFYFFLTGLRVTHNAFHGSLGLSPRATDGVMFILSILMLGAHHAVQVTHMRHHRYCLNEKDVEGSVARQGMWETLLKGPLFPYLIHRNGWLYANKKQRHWIVVELTANILWLMTVWLWLESDALQLLTLLMLLAYCFSAFFAVWSVHHDCDQTPNQHNGHNGGVRSLRSAWKSRVFYQMFFHDEHHLFPHVPNVHLAELAQRLDAAGYQVHKAVL